MPFQILEYLGTNAVHVICFISDKHLLTAQSRQAASAPLQCSSRVRRARSLHPLQHAELQIVDFRWSRFPQLYYPSLPFRPSWQWLWPVCSG